MAFGQIARNKIGDIRKSPLQFGALLQCMRHRLSREIFLGCEMPIEAAMSQAYVLHDGVKPDTIDPLSRNKREAVSTIRARFSAAFSRVTRIVVRSP